MIKKYFFMEVVIREVQFPHLNNKCKTNIIIIMKEGSWCHGDVQYLDWALSWDSGFDEEAQCRRGWWCWRRQVGQREDYHL